MSPELDALVEKVARALLDSARNMKQSIPSWEGAAKWRHPECGFTMQDAARIEALAAIRAVAEATREATEAMTDAGDHAHYCKSVDAGSPWPTEYPNDGGGPMGYAWRAMFAASPLGEAMRDQDRGLKAAVQLVAQNLEDDGEALRDD